MAPKKFLHYTFNMRRKALESTGDIEELVRQHQQTLHAYAFSFVRDSHAADDIVQETLIRAWRYLPTFRGEGSLQGWLMRICGNVARTYLRKYPPHRTSHIEEEIPARGDATSQSDLKSLISTLSVEHRTVVTLCLILGFPYDEAAEILEVPVGTIRSRLFRAREALVLAIKDTETTHAKAV